MGFVITIQTRRLVSFRLSRQPNWPHVQRSRHLAILFRSCESFCIDPHPNANEGSNVHERNSSAVHATNPGICRRPATAENSSRQREKAQAPAERRPRSEAAQA